MWRILGTLLLMLLDTTTALAERPEIVRAEIRVLMESVDTSNCAFRRNGWFWPMGRDATRTDLQFRHGSHQPVDAGAGGPDHRPGVRAVPASEAGECGSRLWLGGLSDGSDGREIRASGRPGTTTPQTVRVHSPQLLLRRRTGRALDRRHA